MKKVYANIVLLCAVSGLSAAAVTGGNTTTSTTATNPGVQNPTVVPCPKPAVAKPKESEKPKAKEVARPEPKEVEKRLSREVPKPAPIQPPASARAKK